jgi:hypothetical protein
MQYIESCGFSRSIKGELNLDLNNWGRLHGRGKKSANEVKPSWTAKSKKHPGSYLVLCYKWARSGQLLMHWSQE